MSNLISGSEPSSCDITLRGFGQIPTIHGQPTNGTEDVPTRSLLGQMLLGIGCRPYTGTKYTEHSNVALHYVASEDQTDTSQGAQLNVVTTPKGHTWEDRETVATFASDMITFNKPVAFSSSSGCTCETAFNTFAGAVTGWSTLTTDDRYFKQSGKLVYFVINLAGVSNSGVVSIPIPVPARTALSHIEGQCGLVINNGVAGGGRWSINPATGILTVWPGVGGSFATTGNKEVRLSGFYEAA